MPSKIIVTLALGALFALTTPALARQGYYQQPAATDDALIFSAEGDLWRKASDTDQAVRLTTHDRLEGQARVSPDGRMIAFAASFDAEWSSSSSQVYVMPAQGGPPRQLTYEIAPVVVRGWSPDGQVLYTSRDIPGSSRPRELRLVHPHTKAVTRIPLRYATTGTFSDDGTTLFFQRHGVSTVNDNARVYRGGGMAQLWRFRLDSEEEALRLAPDFDGPVHDPMYWQGRIYFISDQSGWDNLWSMDTQGQGRRQHTDFSGWRLQDASLRDGIIHYQRGADIYRYDIATGREHLVKIDLISDGNRSRRRWIEDPLHYLETASLGADNRRVAVTARGQVSVMGTDRQRRVAISLPAGARAREAVLDPAGRWVYVILGQDETSELWRFRADGSGEGEQLTDDATTHRWRLRLSPDGNTLLHTDMAKRLFALDLETGTNRLLYTVAAGPDDAIDIASFSPGGRYLAITSADFFPRSAVVVIDLKTDRAHTLTSPRYASYSPAFSPDGQWLYFISDRHFSPTPGSPWGERRMGVHFDKRGQVFALALTADARFPFHAPNELDLTADAGAEAAAGEVPDAADGGDAGQTVAAVPEPDIDWAAASRSLYPVPVAAGNYDALSVTAERLYLLDRTGDAVTIKTLAIDHEAPELETFLDKVVSYALSGDGEALLVRSKGEPGSLLILPASEKAPADTGRYTLRTSGWRLGLEPREEWRQQFLDGWRMHRDYAFDHDLRGVDWRGVRDQLLPLAARIGHRSELDDLFSQMVYPLGILHSQIVPGELPTDPENAAMATLGAHYAAAQGGVRITHIYGHEFERPETAGPLRAPGVDVREGDIIVEVNRRPVRTVGKLVEALYDQAGEQVLLTLKRGDDLMEELAKPLPAKEDARLRYQDWVQDNARKVRELSDNEIGYLHLRAMGSGDVASFARDWFAQLDKDGIVIDVRDNRGGNIDSILISELLRKVWAFWNAEGISYGNMQRSYRGHLAVLVNAGTYSDGDTFSAAVKTLGLAPLIGERTAGAGIWLSSRNRLTDGGRARIAETAQYSMDGEWLIEGRGVSPDQTVVAPPHALFKGHDAQINAAVAYLTEKIATEPVPALVPKPLPPVGGYGVDVTPRH